jgi:hypothetical protein
MELLRALDEILKVTPFKVFMEGNTCILEEPAIEDYPSTRIKIKNPREALVYRFDFNRSEIDLFPYLNEKVEGLTRMCDYIIFYQRKGKLYVFLCELKSKNRFSQRKYSRTSLSVWLNGTLMISRNSLCGTGY